MFNSFKQGLLSHTLTPLVLALAFVLITVFGTQYIGEKNVFLDIVSEGHLLIKKNDDATHAALELSRINKVSNSKPLMVFLGSSSAREALYTQEELNKLFSGYSVHKLTTSSQSLSVTMQYVDKLPKSEGGLLFLGLNYLNFKHSHEDHLKQYNKVQLISKSTSLANFLDVQPKLIDNLWLEKFLYQASRLKSRYLRRGEYSLMSYNTYMYDDKKEVWSSKAKEFNKIIETKHRESFYNNKELNVNLLKNIISLATEKNYRVVFFDLPLNPVAREITSDLVKDFKVITKRLSSEFNIPQYNFSWSLGLKPEHFHDYSHLNISGRKIYQSKLIELINGDI